MVKAHNTDSEESDGGIPNAGSTEVSNSAGKVPRADAEEKAVAAAKKREAPANGYFQLPDDLEVYYFSGS
ncbi:hypothetical protein SDJN03_00604, partial [Cucurbita argyrosperma subsp. sororia]